MTIKLKTTKNYQLPKNLYDKLVTVMDLEKKVDDYIKDLDDDQVEAFMTKLNSEYNYISTMQEIKGFRNSIGKKVQIELNTGFEEADFEASIDALDEIKKFTETAFPNFTPFDN